MTSDRPLLLMHIPKTAGTTLCWIASGQYPADKFHTVYPGYQAQLDGLVAAAHRTNPPAAAIGHFWFGIHESLPHGGIYYTMLRDPVDQVLSMYNHLATSDDPVHRTVLPDGAGLDDLVEHDWGVNLQTQYVAGLSRAAVDADPEGAYRRAVENLTHHFIGVGLVERFAESIRQLSRSAGWKVPKYPRLNRTEDRPVRIRRADLSSVLEGRLLAANANDLRLYEYVKARFRV